MNVSAELLLAATRVRLLAQNIPERDRPDVAEAWSELLDHVENSHSERAAILAIMEWRAGFEARLWRALDHSSLTS